MLLAFSQTGKSEARHRSRERAVLISAQMLRTIPDVTLVNLTRLQLQSGHLLGRLIRRFGSATPTGPALADPSDPHRPVDPELVTEAVELARMAGELTLRYFRSAGLAIDEKGDGTPVTAADRGAERLLREELARRHPDDGVLGEEEAELVGTSGRRWILDPIDGTKAFTHGVPLYTNLLAVEDEHGPAVGVINVPALGETVWAGRGLGCFCNDDPARVSTRDDLAGAYVSTSSFAPWSDPALAAARAALLNLRTWGDGYGYVLVATGRVEAMVDPVAELYDLAPMPVIIAEAGGHFTSLSGDPDPGRGQRRGQQRPRPRRPARPPRRRRSPGRHRPRLTPPPAPPPDFSCRKCRTATPPARRTPGAPLFVQDVSWSNRSCTKNCGGAGVQSSGVKRRVRPAFVCARRFLSSRRRRLAPADGRVGRRGVSTWRASANRSRSRSVARARFWRCERSSEAATRSSGAEAPAAGGPAGGDRATAIRQCRTAARHGCWTCWRAGRRGRRWP